MDYKKINKKNYNIHLINTDRFKLVTVNVYFSKKNDTKEYKDYAFLVRFLAGTTKNYNTEASFLRKLEELYSIYPITHSSYTADMHQFEIGLDFLNPKFTEDSMWESSFKIYEDMLMKPNIVNNEFNLSLFDYYKKRIENTIKSKKEDPISLSDEKFCEIFYKNTSYGRSILPTIEELETASPKTVYEQYKKFLSEFEINVMVLGEIGDNENNIIKYIDRIFSKFKTKKYEYKLYDELKNRKLVEKTFESDFNQSQLIMGYSFNNLTEYERDYVLVIYVNILGIMNNSLLFTKVREESGLCYHIEATINRMMSSMIISSGINKENYKKTVDLVKKCINIMEDKNYIDSEIEKAKMNVSTALNDFYDNPYRIMNYYYSRELMHLEDLETRKEKLLKVTSKEIAELNKKIKLQVIYLLKGVGE